MLCTLVTLHNMSGDAVTLDVLGSQEARATSMANLLGGTQQQHHRRPDTLRHRRALADGAHISGDGAAGAVHSLCF
jgi:hypothetical protein